MSNDRRTQKLEPLSEEDLAEYLELITPEIDAAILDRCRPIVTASALVEAALQAGRLVSELMICPKESWRLALLLAAASGLRIGPPYNESYLVPRWIQKLGYKVVVWDPSYKGLVKMLRRAGTITDVEARVVYAGDQFSYGYGDSEFLDHRPVLDQAKRGDLFAAYVVFHLAHGRKQRHLAVLAEEDIARHRAASFGSEKPESPWRKHPAEMWKKTAVRSEAKWLDHGDDYALAIEAANQFDTGELDLRGLFPGKEFALPPSDATELEPDEAPATVRERVAARAAEVAARVNSEQLGRLKANAHTPEIAAALGAQAPPLVEGQLKARLDERLDELELSDGQIEALTAYLNVPNLGLIPRAALDRAYLFAEILSYVGRAGGDLARTCAHFKVGHPSELTTEQLEKILAKLRLAAAPKISEHQAADLRSMAGEHQVSIDAVCKRLRVKSLAEIPADRFDDAVRAIGG